MPGCAAPWCRFGPTPRQCEQTTWRWWSASSLCRQAWYCMVPAELHHCASAVLQLPALRHAPPDCLSDLCIFFCVQGYQAGGSGGARRNAAGPAGPASDLEAGAVVGRYLQQYEQSINPFAGQAPQAPLPSFGCLGGSGQCAGCTEGGRLSSVSGRRRGLVSDA